MSTSAASASSGRAAVPFSPATSAWFDTTFAAPTAAQSKGWPAISSGEHTLILAPTGSGKTLASFLWSIDRLMTDEVPEKNDRLRVLYLSPLRALAVDVDRNLRAPLGGIAMAAERLDIPVHLPTVGVRTGDTPPKERSRMARTPPDILITTPESLYLLLTSKARETLTNVQAVIIDEIHALAPGKRGAHMAVSLERLEDLVIAAGNPAPQRIGLSATQRPLEEIATFLGGHNDAGERPVTIVDAGVRKELDIEVIVPVEDMSDLGKQTPADTTSYQAMLAGPTRKSIWPSVTPRLLDLILEHHSTLIFVNARRLAERLAAQLNELHADRLAQARQSDPDLEPSDAGAPELVKAHHGSLSRERRLLIEDELKSGTLRGLVATSSLELGIDMGAVDLVVQVESPGSVARGLQRIGRAGHQVGEPSRGKVFPKFRHDLLEVAVVTERMERGAIEATRYPRNPIDVLAQQIVAMCAMDEWTRDDLAALVRRSANFHEISDDVLDAVLDLLSGRYPSEEFSELRPRIVWDRIDGTLRGRAGAQRLAVTNPGTIPDRGLFGVFLPDGTRVGELDEEMVHESRPGETFILGASTWRIEDITFERVVVTPAPGQPGKMPFWHGDGPGRPLELGKAMGAFVRELRAMPDREEALARLRTEHHLDDWASDNLLRYLEEQAEAAGAVPDDRTIVVERFRDEIGDWRVCILSPFGAQVHAPWAMAIDAKLRAIGAEAEVLWSDDGIALRLHEAAEELPPDILDVDPAAIEAIVVEQLAGTAMFTTIFREAAGRALLLPKRRPGQRTALWQQRQRAANLLQVAAKYPTFPILLEATRECLQDIFDLPGLKQVLTDLRSRKLRVIRVDTEHASPFASSLMFSWVGTYMYEYDAPMAERRAAALALDRDLLRELLGDDELRELIDADVLADLELELQLLADGYRARDADELHDVLRRLGPLTLAELDVRAEGDAQAWAEQLLQSRRVFPARVAGEEVFAAAEDAGRLRDALGVSLPPGLPAAFTETIPTPLEDLLARYARTHGPFTTGAAALRFGLANDRVAGALQALETQDRIVAGGFRPGARGAEWVDQEVLRRLKRRSLAALRREVEPVDGAIFARFLSAWHGVDSKRRGLDALVEVIAQLQGSAIPASVLERDVFRSRLADYQPSDLDQLCAAGELVWLGSGSIGERDGRVRLYFRDQLGLLAPEPDEELPDGALHDAIRALLAARGACFWPDLLVATEASQEETLAALWDLVWSGEVTNDTLAPLRALSAKRGKSSGRPRPGRLRKLGPASAAGRWSLTAPLLGTRPPPTTRGVALANQLLERQGIVTREGVRSESIPGGYAAVYQILKAMEGQGQVRRGYFVAGLGAAQFAHSGAVDRLRTERDGEQARAIVLATTDPAQPYGAALAWPPNDGRPARAAGAYVVMVDGYARAYLERGAKSLVTFALPDHVAPDDEGQWANALASLVKRGLVRKIELTRIDGGDPEPAGGTGVAEQLRQAGFTDDYRGLTMRT